MQKLLNIAAYLDLRASENPDQKAVIFPTDTRVNGRRAYIHFTFEQLRKEVDRLAHGLTRAGVEKGMKTILAVTPGPEFVALTFAMFKVGAIPVLIDPGMGKENLFDCIKSVKPQAFIAIPKAHILRLLKPKLFEGLKVVVTVGSRYFWGGWTLEEVREQGRKLGEFGCVSTSKDETAAIVFTTGSTGPPKGVVYFHEQMAGQVQSIQKEYSIGPGDVDFPIFPLFVLFSTAWGIPALIPDMDPTKPAQADSMLLIEGIRDHGVTTSIGSPAVFRRIGSYCAKRKIQLPSVKRFLMVGAPVPPSVLRDFQSVLPAGATYTPYGATEALPVCNISGSHILDETAQLSNVGAGTCVGTPFPGVEVKILPISEQPIEVLESYKEMPVNEVGEVCVRAPQVTREYYENPEATKMAKIKDKQGQIWHRMGDLGYKDQQGRLWFCGRKGHRVQSREGELYTVPCEAIFNQHPLVFRSALVGVGERGLETPVLIVECNSSYTQSKRESLLADLSKLAKDHEHTKSISNFLIHPSFPVDIRHNAKIFREKLKVWAKEQMQKGQL